MQPVDGKVNTSNKRGVHKMRKHTKLNKQERKLIARWKEEGISNNECARRLGRDSSTVGRELKRNSSTCLSNNFDGEKIYEPLAAHTRAEERKQKAWKSKHPLKSPKVFRYVIQRLMRGWSPEVIAGRMRKEYHEDPSWRIHHESIYQYIYHPDNKKWGLREYLRRGHKRRRKKKGRKVHRSRIPERVSIHNRPKEVETREVFGHWEGDSIVGHGRDHGLHTSYERKSSLIRMYPMESIDSESSFKAQLAIYRKYPKKAIKSTTLDNGKEHVKHKQLENELGIKSYFADPYSSWQRGGNENANLWIRYYFPKGTDFRKLRLEEIQAVEDELNNRPRKRLNYQTPNEVFQKELQGLHS